MVDNEEGHDIAHWMKPSVGSVAIESNRGDECGGAQMLLND